jgi:hypothetical protein
VTGDDSRLAARDLPEEAFQPLDVHGLAEAVAQGLLHQGVVVRDLASAGHLEACDHWRKSGPSPFLPQPAVPKCQTLAKERWLEARCAELLPVPHLHPLFTLPHEIIPLAPGKSKGPPVSSGLGDLAALRSGSQVARGRDRDHDGAPHLGQNLSQHLHVHCVLSGGALAPDGRWIPAKRGFLFPVRALSVVFRRK